MFIIGLAFSGCSSESIQSGAAKEFSESGFGTHANRPPTIVTSRIVPNPLRLNQQISVQADALDPDGDIVTYRYQWRLNEEALVGQTHGTLSSSVLKRGDRLSVEVVPYDGIVEGFPVRLESIVENTLPEIAQLTFEPTEVRVGQGVRAAAIGTDADQDPIEYRYRWWRNNSEVADGDMRELDTTGYVKGDTIVVEVTPSDQTSKGKSRLSAPITIMNSPPTITSAPPSIIERGRYIYSVTASDPDGDQLTYALETAPPGMKIDKASGRIEWPLTSKLVGHHKVRVTATDDEDAKAFQEFDLTFSAPVSSSRLGFSKNFRLNTRLVSPFPALLE
ncbi:MAG TPA: putative Ig domain-containing protein [Nitrospiraceae bacterium]|nr:putative Ig domain-containing protein [Nitrospiraceae bacterium]